MEVDAIEMGSRTKAYYICGMKGHLKRNCLKGAAEVIEEWIKVTKER